MLHHVELYVSNLNASRRFWHWFLCDVQKYECAHAWSEGVSYKQGNAYLVFVQVTAQHLQPCYHRKRTGLNHLAFHAPTKDAVDRLALDVKEKGYSVLYDSPIQSGDHYALFFEDPDRIKVEYVYGGAETPMAALKTKSARSILRLTTDDDAEQLASFHQENKAHLTPWEPTRSDALFTTAYWKKTIATYGREFLDQQSLRLLIVDTSNGQLIGMINFTSFERGPFQNCRLGYKIAAAYQGQGLMFEALQAAIRYLLIDLDFHRIEANYIPTNVRSARVLRRLGFTKHGIAKNYLKIAGKWQDHVLTSVTRDDFLL